MVERPFLQVKDDAVRGRVVGGACLRLLCEGKQSGGGVVEGGASGEATERGRRQCGKYRDQHQHEDQLEQRKTRMGWMSVSVHLLEVQLAMSSPPPARPSGPFEERSKLSVLCVPG